MTYTQRTGVPRMGQGAGTRCHTSLHLVVLTATRRSAECRQVLRLFRMRDKSCFILCW